jgi:hypothetical protein
LKHLRIKKKKMPIIVLIKHKNLIKILKKRQKTSVTFLIKRPIPRAKAKLIKYKDAAQLALILILLKVKQTTLILCLTPVIIVHSVKMRTHILQTQICSNFSGVN